MCKNTFLIRQNTATVDKYIRQFASGELFKEELFLFAPNVELSIQGNVQSPLVCVYGRHKSADDLEGAQVFLNSVLKQIPQEPYFSMENSCSLYFGGIENEVNFMQLVQETDGQVFFVWDMDKRILGVDSNQFIPMKLGDKWILFLPDVMEVKDSKPMKAALWKAMKYIYNI